MTDRDRVRLSGVHPLCVARYTLVDQDMAKQGTPIFVIQGIRTTEQQQADYAQGRTVAGKIITYCDGTTHKGPHQVRADGYGRAIDFAFVPSKARPSAFDQTWPWHDVGDSIENNGLVWGGRWHLADLDHCELSDAALETLA